MGRNLPDSDIAALSHEVSEIASKLDKLMEVPLSNMMADRDRIATLAFIYRSRSIRAEAFGEHSDLFADAAWDILLDAAIMEAKRRPVSITSACGASRVPATTALRWIDILVERGLLDRIEDTQDARRKFLRLTKKGRQMLFLYADRLIEIARY